MKVIHTSDWHLGHMASLKKVVGKKVGIISHVEYLKDNIHPQILVEPVGNGLSVIKDPV